jgi:hypothetical protein
MTKPKRDTPLQLFLNAPANTKTRERMFFNQLYFDVKIAAARRGYPLSVFEPEVDRDGFDVIFDDGDSTRHCQLKSATKSSKTAHWYTIQRFLRPDLNQVNLMFFEPSPEGIGLNGGVIAIVIDDSKDPCGIEYLYCDVYLLEALACGIVLDSVSAGAHEGTTRHRARKVVSELRKRGIKEKIRLHRSLFVKVRSADCLLSILQLHSVEQGGMAWAFNVAKAVSEHFTVDDDGNPQSPVEMATVAQAHAGATALLTLIDEPRLERFKSPIRGPDPSNAVGSE